MPRVVILAFFCLALGARSGGAVVNERDLPGAGGAPEPQPGRNFSVAHPRIAMIWIAPGTFLMSSTHGAGDDTRVTLTRGYWLGATEVTQAQWQAVNDVVPLPSFHKGSDHPVERVAWETVVEFCQTLTARERAEGRLPEGYGYALPSEAQWEYACRAGTTGPFAGDLPAMAWYEANSGGVTHPVAQKQPNAWGLYDMHGNVQEWCADWYGGYPGGQVEDPMGIERGQFHVQRGGAAQSTAGFCRSAFRSWSPTTAGSSSAGFRVALVWQPKP